MLDPLTERFIALFPTLEEFNSAEAKVVLSSIAWNYSVDTYEVERTFSEVRRRVKGKKCSSLGPKNFSHCSRACRSFSEAGIRQSISFWVASKQGFNRKEEREQSKKNETASGGVDHGEHSVRYA